MKQKICPHPLHFLQIFHVQEVRNIVITLLKSLLASYSITAMEKMLMKALMMDYVTACLMHEMLKHNKKEPQCKDATMVLQQSKGGNSFPC